MGLLQNPPFGALNEPNAKIADLRRELKMGIDELDRGESEEFDESNIHELAEGVKKRGRALLERAKLKGS